MEVLDCVVRGPKSCERVVPWICRGQPLSLPRHSQPELQNECPNAHSGSKLQRRSPKETSTQDDMGVLMGWWGWVMTVTQVQDKHKVVQQLLRPHAIAAVQR